MKSIDSLIRAQSIVASLAEHDVRYLPIVYRIESEIAAIERVTRAAKIKVIGARVRDRAA